MYRCLLRGRQRDMMKEKMRKYFGMACLLAIMLLFPIEWYRSTVSSISDADSIEIFFQSINGMQIFTFNGCRICITYILCLLIQYLVIENHKGYVIAMISKILLIFQFNNIPVLPSNLSHSIGFQYKPHAPIVIV